LNFAPACFILADDRQLLNTAAILIGGTVGLTVLGNSLKTQEWLNWVWCIIVYVGLSTTWSALSGGFARSLKQLNRSALAAAGNAAGKLLRCKRNEPSAGTQKNASTKPECSGQRGAKDSLRVLLLFCVDDVTAGRLQMTGRQLRTGNQSVLDGYQRWRSRKRLAGCAAFSLPFSYQGRSRSQLCCSAFLENKDILTDQCTAVCWCRSLR